jgi:hypothetical protein
MDMAKFVRVPITNYLVGGDYTGTFRVGPGKTEVDLLLDTGSSALALDAHKYKPDVQGGDKLTDYAQTAVYGDNSSWTGALIHTTVAAGHGDQSLTLPNANVSVAYSESRDMFQGCDGILGLAYAPLDDAYKMPGPTWPKRYNSAQVQDGKRSEIAPYLTQLADHDIAFERISFLTRRSIAREGSGGRDDPMNQGVMIIGGGAEAKDLYTGEFKSVKVLADAWYNTNLLSITVGNTTPITIPARGLKGNPSNSIVDSGTNSLNLGTQLLNALIQKFSPAQQQMLTAAIFRNRVIAAADLDLAQWPSLSFELQAETGQNGVALTVAPGDYWQIDAYKAGAALCAISQGDDGLAILGLPLMNGYFTYFDGVADNHRGVIRFAAAKGL